MIKNKIEKRSYPYTEPEWNAENINRKAGATTFNQCGWCSFASCGSRKYNCYLRTSCSLLKSYGSLKSYGLGENVYWDTPCIILMLGKVDLQACLNSKGYKIKECKKEILSLRESQAHLKSIIKKSKNKPPLPDNRIYDYKNGETVWVFCAISKDNAGDDKWHQGIVVPGYRSGDGCVSYVLDDYSQTKGNPWGCGVGVPCVLKDWEYKYFRKNTDEFEIWLSLCDKEYNGEKVGVEKYLLALKKGGVE